METFILVFLLLCELMYWARLIIRAVARTYLTSIYLPRSA